jgi:hypothetical protein
MYFLDIGAPGFQETVLALFTLIKASLYSFKLEEYLANLNEQQSLLGS